MIFYCIPYIIAYFEIVLRINLQLLIDFVSNNLTMPYLLIISLVVNQMFFLQYMALFSPYLNLHATYLIEMLIIHDYLIEYS